MQRRPHHQRQPHPEIVNLEDLAPCKRQHRDTEELRDRDPAKHASAHINERGPRPGVPTGSQAPLRRQARRRAREDSGRGELECAGDVGAELDCDADGDDEVDEGDGVERDVCEGHGAEDGGDDHGHGDGDDEAGGEGAQEQGGEEEDEGGGGAEEGAICVGYAESETGGGVESDLNRRRYRALLPENDGEDSDDY